MDIKRLRHEVEFLGLITLIFLIWYSGRHFRIDTQALQSSLERLPLFSSGISYIILYVIVTFFVFFSKDIFWFVGAVLFGAYLSTLFICIAEVINAVILFHLARSLGRAYIQKSLIEKYRNLDEKLGKINFFWLFIFRAVPLIPYRFMDLAAGLTRINFKKYLAAVIFGSPLKMFWIQYILSGVGKSILNNPYAMVEYFLANKNLLMFSLVYLILVIAVMLKLKIKG